MTTFDGQTVCPSCKRVNDMYSTTEDNPPEPGDISLCWKCAVVSVFDFKKPGNLRLPEPEELSEIMQDPHVNKARMAILESATPREAISKLSSDTWEPSDLIEEK